jgi:hypothetical protein
LAYFVCEDCHEMDADATECDFSFNMHVLTDGSELATCHICGKVAACVPCYAYEIVSILNGTGAK